VGCYAVFVSLGFEHPVHLWLLLLLVPVGWLGWRRLRAIDPTRRGAALALRFGLLLLLVAMLAGVQAVERHDELAVVALWDTSESVRRMARPPRVPGDPPLTGIQPWLERAARGRKDGDRVGVVAFDGRPSVRSLPSPVPDFEGGAVADPAPGTDLAGAVRLGLALFPPGAARRMVVVSDGRDTFRGPEAVMEAARSARAAGVPVDVVPLDYAIGPEVMVDAVHVPAEAAVGQTVPVRVVLRATRPAAGRLHLARDGQSLDLDPGGESTGLPVAASGWTRGRAAEGTGEAAKAGTWVKVRTVEVPVEHAGARRFEAVFEPAEGGDTLGANNRAEALSMVRGRSRVLLVDGIGGEAGGVLAAALAERDVAVETVPPEGMPGRLGELGRYDAILFQDVHARRVSPALRDRISRYVHELGGGFLMVGGPDSFSPGGWTGTPVDRILPVESEVPDHVVRMAGALVLVIDRSGSMGQAVSGVAATQQQLANEAAILAVEQLDPEDLVGVVAFDGSPRWAVELGPNQRPRETAGRIEAISPGGGTNIHPALKTAVENLASEKAARTAARHVILLSDGNSQGGDYEALLARAREHEITVSTVGIGDGVDHELLGRIAAMGGGQYHPVSDPTTLPRIFIEEAKEIRRKHIREERFTPAAEVTGSPYVSGGEAFPPLEGFVLTGRKHDPRVFVPLLGPEGAPLFAHWRVGLGQAAAFTSDATSRWARHWIDWSGYGDFWARVVRGITRGREAGGYALDATVEGASLRLRLEAVGEAGEAGEGGFVNFLDVKGSVLAPGGELEQVELEQVAPGRYEASLSAEAAGSYVVHLFATGPDGRTRSVAAGATQTPGPELRALAPDPGLLGRVAGLTGGRRLAPNADPAGALFDRAGIEPVRSERAIWGRLLPWLLLILLLDIANRRFAWQGHAVRAWFAGRLAGLRSPAPVQASGTLGALKRRRARAGAAPSEAPARASAAEAAEAAEAPVQKAAHEEVPDTEGATDDGGSPEAAPPPGQHESATHRLRAARERARRRMEGRE